MSSSHPKCLAQGPGTRVTERGWKSTTTASMSKCINPPMPITGPQGLYSFHEILSFHCPCLTHEDQQLAQRRTGRKARPALSPWAALTDAQSWGHAQGKRRAVWEEPTVLVAPEGPSAPRLCNQERSLIGKWRVPEVLLTVSSFPMWGSASCPCLGHSTAGAPWSLVPSRFKGIKRLNPLPHRVQSSDSK